MLLLTIATKTFAVMAMNMIPLVSVVAMPPTDEMTLYVNDPMERGSGTGDGVIKIFYEDLVKDGAGYGPWNSSLVLDEAPDWYM